MLSVFLEAWRERRLSQSGLELTGGFERQLGTDDSLPTSFLERGAATSRAVCKIETSGVDFQGRPGTWHGTGFLVGPGLLLTNNHVLNNRATARNAIAQFNYQTEDDSRFAPRRVFHLDPDRLFLTSPAVDGLDFTLVHIDGDAQEEFGTIPLRRGAFVINRGEQANIHHHPLGQPKRVSLRANKSIDFDELFLHYVTDTESGSSGAPVLDDTWRLIALHHAWRTLPPDIQAPAGFASTYLNEGVKIAAIIVDIESRLSRPAESDQARRVLESVQGSDSITGYFGVVGRCSEDDRLSALERVTRCYRGGARDIDVAYWDARWFAELPYERAADTAAVIADLNLDIWTLAGCSAVAATILQEQLAREFGQHYELDVSEAHEIATFWNPLTVQGHRHDPGAATGAAPVYRFDAAPRREKGMAPFEFLFAPAAATTQLDPAPAMYGDPRLAIPGSGGGIALDMVFAGLRSPETLVARLHRSGIRSTLADDPGFGAVVVVEKPRSLVRKVVLPPSMHPRPGGSGAIEFCADRESPEQIRRMTGHRPLMLRLALRDQMPAAPAEEAPLLEPPPTSQPEAPGTDDTAALIREFLAWREAQHQAETEG